MDILFASRLASLAKIFGCHTYSFEIKLPSKRGDRLRIKRSRHDVEYDKHFSEKNNKEVKNFCKATGLRRSEVDKIKPEQITKDGNKNVILDFKSKKEYRAMTKNGGGRFIYPLHGTYNIILKAKEKVGKSRQVTVFEKIHHAMDLHSCRRYFVQHKYMEILQELEEKKLDYICRDGSGRRYNKKALRSTSENLGHSRLDVVVKNYL